MRRSFTAQPVLIGLRGKPRGDYFQSLWVCNTKLYNTLALCLYQLPLQNNKNQIPSILFNLFTVLNKIRLFYSIQHIKLIKTGFNRQIFRHREFITLADYHIINANLLSFDFIHLTLKNTLLRIIVISQLLFLGETPCHFPTCPD